MFGWLDATTGKDLTPIVAYRIRCIRLLPGSKESHWLGGVLPPTRRQAGDLVLIRNAPKAVPSTAAGQEVIGLFVTE